MANKGFKSMDAGKQAVKGGSGHMFGNTGVSKQKPGTTSPTKGGSNKSTKVSGGSGSMAGFKGVSPAKKA